MGKHGRPTYDQARRIVAKLGGELKLSQLLTELTGSPVNRSTIYRWSYARPYGSDGIIPTFMIPAIQRLARIEGIILSAEDWLPTRIVYPDPADETSTAESQGVALEPALRNS